VKKNKKVEVLLKSGKTFSGVIHTLGNQCVILAQSGAKSLFDAIIRIEEIAALEVQVRTT
jgi:small nuclear ribonucleoprotein (snRNP)-like protein